MTTGRLRTGGERLLPAERLHLPTTAVLSIMIFTMLLAAAAGLLFANASASVSQSVENRFVIQLPAPVADRLPAAMDAARAAPGVRSVTAVPEAEMRETLRDWIGEAASSPELPVPALVTLDLAANADVPALRTRIETAVPGASLVAQSAELEPLLRSLRTLQWLTLATVLLIVTATAAAVVLAARATFDTHRPTIEIMHGIGATDMQLTRLFERKIAVDAAAGAAIGTAAALIVVVILAGAAAGLGGALGGPALLGWTDALVLIAIPLLSILLATMVARWTVLRALRETL